MLSSALSYHLTTPLTCTFSAGFFQRLNTLQSSNQFAELASSSRSKLQIIFAKMSRISA